MQHIKDIHFQLTPSQLSQRSQRTINVLKKNWWVTWDKNNFYIVQLLLLRGSSITPPHDYFCDCIECSNMRVFDSVKYSRSRLNTYKALASPAYLSLNSEDPVLAAFDLSQKLEALSEIEKEYKVSQCV